MSVRWVNLGRRGQVKASLRPARLPAPVSDSEQMVPLINVVFLLMVFFLLAGSISQRDNLAIRPPESASEQRRSADGLELVVFSDEKLLLNGEVIALGHLAAELKDRFAVTGSAGVGSTELPPDSVFGRVEIRADGELSAGVLKPVLAVLQEAGIKEIKLLTRLP